MKTSEMTGPVLDRAVAMANGWITYPTDSVERGDWYHTNPLIAPHGYAHNRVYRPNYKPSTSWAHGGPLIEREGISSIRQTDTRWVSEYSNGCGRTDHAQSWGATPLIAAMRCYVLSVLGDEVEIPEELK